MGNTEPTKMQLKKSYEIMLGMYIAMSKENRCLQKAIRRKNKLIKRLRSE